jgi:protein dithiol oxidoreductase (disulfide-forming)
MLSIPALIRRLLPLTVAFAAALSLASPVLAQVGLQEGKQYMRLKNPMPVETGKKIEVIEFFSYGCPHCADFEPVVESWLKTIPPDVQFRRVPVMFQERWIALAKVYYTLDALGEETKLTPDVFAAIHGKGTNLSSDKIFFDWAASKGLDRKKVEDMYNSFAINGKINRAKQQAQQYGVQSVPLIIVDGKFMTDVAMIGSHEQMPTAINALIDKAKTERTKP